MKRMILIFTVACLMACSQSQQKDKAQSSENSKFAVGGTYYASEVNRIPHEQISGIIVSVDQDFEAVLSDSFPKLKIRNLEISRWLTNSDTISAILKKFPDIDSLGFRGSASTIPPDLFLRCKQIKYFNLQTSTDQSLVLDFQNAAHLETIDVNNILYNNYILRPEDSVEEMRLIRQYEISDSTFVDHLATQIAPIPTLKILLLNRFNLPIVPPAIFKLHNIERLVLYADYINQVDCRFSEMRSLKYISLEGNKFQQYPSCLATLIDTPFTSDNCLGIPRRKPKNGQRLKPALREFHSMLHTRKH